MTFDKIFEEFNEQMNLEFESAYLYLSMSIYFEKQSLNGFANWMRMQYDEEREHAMKFYQYILDRDHIPELRAFEKPKNDWEGTLDVFEETLKHEKMITSRINHLMAVAVEVKDFASQQYLQWFIAEQVEEEATVNEILDQLKMIKDSPSAMYFLNNEMGKRQSDPEE